jgi:dTDP-4-amino-4,6-dideoxygalactose transaminase
MMCQHYGRSAEPGFPAAYTAYVDSLVFTFRVSPLIARLFPGQFRRLGAQTRARQANAATLRDALAGCALIELPRERKGFRSAYYYMTMNFRPEVAGISRETFCKALIAEGVGAWPYVPEAIHHWRRLQWRDYDGPVPFWIPALKAAGTDYAATRLPGCEHKIAHAIELLLVSEYRRAPAAMRRIASAFEKVQDNLPALRRYEEQQHARQDPAVVTAAKRAAASYRRRR